MVQQLGLDITYSCGIPPKIGGRDVLIFDEFDTIFFNEPVRMTKLCKKHRCVGFTATPFKEFMSYEDILIKNAGFKLIKDTTTEIYKLDYESREYDQYQSLINQDEGPTIIHCDADAMEYVRELQNVHIDEAIYAHLDEIGVRKDGKYPIFASENEVYTRGVNFRRNEGIKLIITKSFST